MPDSISIGYSEHPREFHRIHDANGWVYVEYDYIRETEEWYEYLGCSRVNGDIIHGYRFHREYE